MSLKKKIILIILSIFVGVELILAGFGLNIYNEAKRTMDRALVKIERKEKNSSADVIATKPFSILLLGIDSGGLDREDNGRSDTMIFIIVNPKNKQTTFLSISRDAYVYLDGAERNSHVGELDKINHSYAYGDLGMAMDTVKKLLAVPVDRVISINLAGMPKLVDALGGVDINNKLGEFTVIDSEYAGRVFQTTVKAGRQHADGDTALAYVRMRHEDPKGDIGRQERQQEVLQETIRKLISINSFPRYKRIFKAIGPNLKTNLKWENMVQMWNSYLPAFKNKNIVHLTLQGHGTQIDGRPYYQYLPNYLLLRAQNYVKKQLDFPETLTIEDPQIPTYETEFGVEYQGEHFLLGIPGEKNESSATQQTVTEN